MAKKERWEWMQSWCDETAKGDLPRVLLVGDSITRGYQDMVRKKLAGVCYVDYISTSYAVDSTIYNTIVKAMAADDKYALIHINHGLHGQHMSKRTYKSRMKKLLITLSKKAPLILANTTNVYKYGTHRPDGAWMKRVRERNLAIAELAEELDCPMDDLYSACLTIDWSGRSIDGTHYEAAGYDILSDYVAEAIKKALKAL